MALRVVTAAATSAVLMFLWGFVFWGPVINATARLTAPLPPEAELDVIAPLRAADAPDGMYLYPGAVSDMRDEAAVNAWTNQVEEGPILHMAYRRQGVSPMDPAMFAQGLAHNFVISLLAAMLLAMVAHTLPSFASRAGLLALVSVIAALWTNVGSVIWWFHPPAYAAGQILYTVVGGLLMALATAAIVRPPGKPAG